MKILVAAILVFCVLAVPPAPVAAQFVFVEEVRLSVPPQEDPDAAFSVFASVAFDGEFFWTSRFDRTVLRHDAMFNLIEEFDLPINFGNPRTLEVDRENGNLLLLVNSSRMLIEYTSGLNVVLEYSAIQAGNRATAGLVLDPVTNTTWTAGVDTGTVTQYSREGLELSSFQVDINLEEMESFNSVAIDWVNGTVLLFDPLPNRLVEYTFDGEFVGTPFLSSAENNFTTLLNNFNAVINGIYYDSETARLYLIGAGGELAIWEDLSRLPVTAPLLGDVNLDGVVNFLDIAPFINLLANSNVFQEEGDLNEDGVINFLDIAPFIQVLTGGGQ